MSEILFKTHPEITDDWLFYIESEANALSQRDAFSINNYIDREAFNPEMKKFLSSDEAQKLLENESEGDKLSLNLFQNRSFNLLPENLGMRFRKFKAFVKKIFCKVVSGITDVNPKEIIKGVILALIPFFSTGLPAIVLPLVVGLCASLIKYGYEATCAA